MSGQCFIKFKEPVVINIELLSMGQCLIAGLFSHIVINLRKVWRFFGVQCCFRAFVSQKPFFRKFFVFYVLDACGVIQKKLNNILHRLDLPFISEIIMIFCKVPGKRNTNHIVIDRFNPPFFCF